MGEETLARAVLRSARSDIVSGTANEAQQAWDFLAGATDSYRRVLRFWCLLAEVDAAAVMKAVGQQTVRALRKRVKATHKRNRKGRQGGKG